MIERVRLSEEAKQRLADRTRLRAKPNRKQFTDLWIGRLKPPEDRQELYWDTVQRGLSLLVSPGGTKTFRSQFKLHGKWISRTIGRYGEVGADDDGEDFNIRAARERTRKDRDLAKKGTDPREGDIEASALSYAAVVEQFIDLYAKERQRHWNETRRVLLKNCDQSWLTKPIGKITKREAQDLIDGFKAAGHGPKAANTLSWLRTLWRWAFKRDLVTSPLMDAVSLEYAKRTRTKTFTDEEIRATWKAADKLEPAAGAYVKLLILLAPRRSALAHMRWTDLDDPDRPTLWTTPADRVKQSRKAELEKGRTYQTPLPVLARRVLLGLYKHDLNATGPVFAGRAKGIPTTSGTFLKRELVRHGAPKTFAYHAWRHTIGSWLQEQKHDEFEIGLVLNHANGGTVTSRYMKGSVTEWKRELFEKWAAHVEKLVATEGVALLR